MNLDYIVRNVITVVSLGNFQVIADFLFGNTFARVETLKNNGCLSTIWVESGVSISKTIQLKHRSFYNILRNRQVNLTVFCCK